MKEDKFSKVSRKQKVEVHFLHGHNVVFIIKTIDQISYFEVKSLR
jgi:hypothetical protein